MSFFSRVVMEQNILYEENSKKFKIFFVVGAIVLYLIAAVDIFLLIFKITNPSFNYKYKSWEYIFRAVVSAAVASLSLYVACSKYMNFSMCISKELIKITTKKTEMAYNTNEFLSYTITEQKRFYSLLKLSFKNNIKVEIITRKHNQLIIVLNALIKKNLDLDL